MVTVRKGSKKKSGKMTSGGKCMWWESGRRFMLPVEANLGINVVYVRMSIIASRFE